MSFFKYVFVASALLSACGAPTASSSPDTSGESTNPNVQTVGDGADASVGNGTSSDTSYLDGRDGKDGMDGADGADGAPGPQGPQGPQGPVGPQGPQGLQGPQGPKGDTGAASTVPGPVGPQGADGLRGPAGVQGPAGPQGPQGPAGAQGIAGAAGAQGPQGPRGHGTSWVDAENRTVQVIGVQDPLYLNGGGYQYLIDPMTGDLSAAEGGAYIRFYANQNCQGSSWLLFDTTRKLRPMQVFKLDTNTTPLYFAFVSTVRVAQDVPPKYYSYAYGASCINQPAGTNFTVSDTVYYVNTTQVVAMTAPQDTTPLVVPPLRIVPFIP